MEKSVTITYNIVNPGKRGSAVEEAVLDEVKRICDAVKAPIAGVVVNCRQTGKKPVAMPTFDELMKLQYDLQIGEITINKSYSNIESPTPHEILEELRRLHDEFGDQISEIGDDDSEDVEIALQNIYVEMETQLDALEDALGGDENGQCLLLSNE
ncbi:MAG: hypothetical protein Q4G65_14565 [bacterium]|nr:hypothetical protein [bacterium]